MHVLLISTYEMGRQPFGLASPAALLRQAGFDVTVVDVSRQQLAPEDVERAGLVALHLPMHTATRLALPVIGRVRQSNPSAHLCCYGLYAPLNERVLRSLGVETVLGGEFEQDLVAAAVALRAGERPAPSVLGQPLAHVPFVTPDRAGLPPLTRYASLVDASGERRTVGYTEASRGCKHLCRHCPVVPVYNGRFRVVPVDVVSADIEAQVVAGAEHITFGDPDFFNGIRHALTVVDEFPRRWPGLTYDVTIKVEHLVRHREHLDRLRETGCLFVTSAVESLDDRVLTLLEKGHTRADFVAAVEACRVAGLTLSPTFVSFTPWTDLEGYCDLLEAIETMQLVEHVAPIQLAIRLLVTHGSRLLELDDVRRLVGPFDATSLTYPWRHRQPEVDDLQAEVQELVGRNEHASRRVAFDAITELAFARAGRTRRAPRLAARVPGTVPYLNEPWYC